MPTRAAPALGGALALHVRAQCFPYNHVPAASAVPRVAITQERAEIQRSSRLRGRNSLRTSKLKTRYGATVSTYVNSMGLAKVTVAPAMLKTLNPAVVSML